MPLLRKFFRNKRGAIAVETAIATPIILFALLPAIDLGIKVYAKQRLMKATKSGTEFVILGARDEEEIWNVINSSYGKDIAQDNVSIDGYCGCIVSDSAPPLRGGNEASENDEQYAYTYAKTATEFGDNMCPAICEDGQTPAELVDITVKGQVKGIVTTEWVTARLQTRVK